MNFPDDLEMCIKCMDQTQTLPCAVKKPQELEEGTPQTYICIVSSCTLTKLLSIRACKYKLLKCGHNCLHSDSCNALCSLDHRSYMGI